MISGKQPLTNDTECTECGRTCTMRRRGNSYVMIYDRRYHQGELICLSCANLYKRHGDFIRRKPRVVYRKYATEEERKSAKKEQRRQATARHQVRDKEQTEYLLSLSPDELLAYVREQDDQAI